MFGLPIQKKSAFTCTCFRRRDGGRSSPSLLSLVGSVLLGAGEIVSQTPDNFVSSHVRPPPQSRRCCVIFENSDFTLMCGPDSFFVSDAHSIFWRPLLPCYLGLACGLLAKAQSKKRQRRICLKDTGSFMPVGAGRAPAVQGLQPRFDTWPFFCPGVVCRFASAPRARRPFLFPPFQKKTTACKTQESMEKKENEKGFPMIYCASGRIVFAPRPVSTGNNGKQKIYGKKTNVLIGTKSVPRKATESPKGKKGEPSHFFYLGAPPTRRTTPATQRKTT